jgi:putative spermidine/putrescine transport system ATP-binding protein
LNLIAGFLEPTRGRILIRGEDVTHVPPNRRNLGMVFQNYSLFPHMTVAENVGFGLKMKRWSAQDAATRTTEALILVHMENFADRYPRQLSGGQQQRVALARAVAPRPSVLLLDEPLSNLDLKLRESMRRELKTLQRELGVTAIFVTHDQEEAMTMSDRVVVMRQGQVEQIGAPTEIYAAPRTRFVASFLGQMNFLDVTLADGHEGATTATLASRGSFSFAAAGPHRHGPAKVGIRPEDIRLRPLAGEAASLTGSLEELVVAGALTQAYVRSGDATLRIDMLSGTVPAGLRPGGRVEIVIPADKIIRFDEPDGSA